MTKRKNRSKRSLASLPKGLPVRGGDRDGINPFEVSQRQPKRAKFHVHNRTTAKSRREPSALAQALQKRQQAIQREYKASKKANVFKDKRIGEYDVSVTTDERNLARLVKERTGRSKRSSKYSLQDDDENAQVLTHRGKAVDALTAKDHAALLSDDEEESTGQLDAADTALHFGGAAGSESQEYSTYGSATSTGRMSQLYSQRKRDLDDLILRRKVLKAERLQSKERQVETFATMDETFAELKGQLNFRDKEREVRQYLKNKREQTLSPEDQEMADWDREMKQYLFVDRRVKATDRTKTPEEIAKEEAERLHELETRRLARMNGDFENDDFSDVSDEEEKSRRRREKTARNRENPEALSDSDDNDDDGDGITTRFTADGLVKVNRDGLVIGKVGETGAPNKATKTSQALPANLSQPLSVGTSVYASYRATEQFDGNESWFTGKIERVHRQDDGSYTYDVEYDDGDYEGGVKPSHIKVVEKSNEEMESEEAKTAAEDALKRKRRKAKEKAR